MLNDSNETEKTGIFCVLKRETNLKNRFTIDECDSSCGIELSEGIV